MTGDTYRGGDDCREMEGNFEGRERKGQLQRERIKSGRKGKKAEEVEKDMKVKRTRDPNYYTSHHTYEITNELRKKF